MIEITRQLNPAPTTFETQLANLKAQRKHYSVACNGCGHVKTYFPSMATDAEIETKRIKRQRNYHCDACATLPRSTATDQPSTATDQPSTAKRISGKVAASGKLKVADMLASGRIKRGDILTVLKSKFGDSTATIIDAKTVNVQGEILTWNKYGEKFTGHVAVNVYKHILVNGILLETLR